MWSGVARWTTETLEALIEVGLRLEDDDEGAYLTFYGDLYMLSGLSQC